LNGEEEESHLTSDDRCGNQIRENPMQPQLNHLAANEHIADLRRTAERERFARVAKQESLLARLIAAVRGRGRVIAERAPAGRSEAEPVPAATDAPAPAEA
jgi:hypothetical protein